MCLPKSYKLERKTAMSEMIRTIITIACSGAVLAFIEFLIRRHDEKNNAFEKYAAVFNKGLEEREKKGLERYTEHKENIEKLNQAILQLTKNDTEMAEYMQYVGAELMGLAHDRLVYLTDKIARRNAITLKEKATLEAIYRPYHDGLHGNGDGQAGYEHCQTLKVISDEMARELDRDKKVYQG